MSGDEIKRLKRGLQQQMQWRSANQTTAIDSITDFIMSVLRPLLHSAVSKVLDWIKGLFTNE